MKHITIAFLMLCGILTGAVPHLSFQPCTEKCFPRVSGGPAGVQRMAGDYRLFWRQNQNLNVLFVDGTTRQKAAAWKRFQNLPW